MDAPLADLRYLERLCKGDRSRMATFIEQYLSDSTELYRALERASVEGDARSLAHAAHDLRPHAHYVGAQRVLELLVEIDLEARRLPPVVRADLVQALLPLVPQLAEELRASLPHHTPR
ncbi:MAG: hypothetical protein U0U25_13800 [Flavobacteriales bacterium]